MGAFGARRSPGARARPLVLVPLFFGRRTKPVGRTRTAPAATASPARLRFAFASCQQYERGWYAAYRHIVADQPDLVAFLGDYIYESTWGKDHVRVHDAPEPYTLDEYLPDNPHILYADSRYRGYVRVDVTPKRWVADLRAMQTVREHDAPCTTVASFAVEDGKPGPVRT